MNKPYHPLYLLFCGNSGCTNYNWFRIQVVYILDQVRALESEMLLRIKQQGLDNITPRILIVSSANVLVEYF